MGCEPNVIPDTEREPVAYCDVDTFNEPHSFECVVTGLLSFIDTVSDSVFCDFVLAYGIAFVEPYDKSNDNSVRLNIFDEDCDHDPVCQPNDNINANRHNLANSVSISYADEYGIISSRKLDFYGDYDSNCEPDRNSAAESEPTVELFTNYHPNGNEY